MNSKPEYLKLQTNIPVTVKFLEYDLPKKWENTSKTTGKPYTSWSYLVEKDGTRYYLSVFDSDHLTLKEFEPMKDKVLTLCKTEVGKGKELHVAYPTTNDFREGIKMAQQIAKQENNGDWNPEEPEPISEEDMALEVRRANTVLLENLTVDMLQTLNLVGAKASELFGENGSTCVNTTFMEYCKQRRRS